MSLLERVRRPSLSVPDWFDMYRLAFANDLFEVIDQSQAPTRMLIEEKAEEGMLTVRAELPGIDPDVDVEITRIDHRLKIRAERHEEIREESKGRVRSEFHYGVLERTIPLPAAAKEDDIEANYADGILEIRVPVDSKRNEATRIPVKHETERSDRRSTDAKSGREMSPGGASGGQQTGELSGGPVGEGAASAGTAGGPEGDMTADERAADDWELGQSSAENRLEGHESDRDVETNEQVDDDETGLEQLNDPVPQGPASLGERPPFEG